MRDSLRERVMNRTRETPRPASPSGCQEYCLPGALNNGTNWTFQCHSPWRHRECASGVTPRPFRHVEIVKNLQCHRRRGDCDLTITMTAIAPARQDDGQGTGASLADHLH
eukprot:6492532-Amphidinium_carterae.3